MTPITSHNSNEEGPSPKIEAAVDSIEPLSGVAAMEISELEAHLTEEPNVTKVVPSVYLELATKSMMHIRSLISPDSSNSVPINWLQCQYIFDKLCETLNNAKECICGPSLQDVPRSDCIFQNLAQTAMEVDKLVGDCCDAQWIPAAMIVANAKEHFASLAFKLRLYRQLLQSIFEKKATKMLTKLQNPKWSDDIKDAEFSIMDRKVQEDRKRLLSRLTQVGSSESENLIKRLDIFSIRGAFLQHNASFVLDPWKVEWKSIKRFRRSQIGKGSCAVVHKVVWLGKYFAEKSFPFPENENFRKEVSFLAGLSHPNILPLFCYATCSRYCSLVMELMDEDLDSLMRNRLGPKTSFDPPFELLEAIDIMLQVAEGMKYLHQNKVIHRDLKAGNILVKCDDGHVYAKVADFGVSKTIDSRCTDSNQTTDMGTTKWMAPELFSEESHDAGPSVSRESDLSLKYPFKVDIYSFGMVCYEILTGSIPFVNCNNMRDLRKRIKDGLRPDIPERCPEQLSTLIKKCYHPNPAERPSFRKICVELRHLMWSLMLNNLELGDSTAEWSNLPGAEHLVVKQFQELFSQHKYKEAADFAADSPQGILRTPETVAKFQSIPVQPGQTSPVVQYFGTLLRKGKLNVFESLELSCLVVNQKKKNLLEKCLAEDKLECSEELGDLVKTLDNDLASKIYNNMRENAKMVAAVAENGQFDRDLIYSKQGQGSLPHSPVGRGSPLISPLVVDLDRSHQQVPEDVYRPVDNNKSGGSGGHGRGTWRIFSLRELHAATNSFNDENKIGEGGFGSVYWGQLPNGDQIAVKRLKVWSTKAEMEFAVEVEILGRVRHKNLLSLRGYCAEGQERLNVYDYMPKLSLLSHLHGQFSSESALNWQRRMKIATGSAEGLAYLHHYAKPHIIRRDIKASNVLLDENFEAQLADFGFAKLIPEGATHVTTRVKGTLGYLAPEYAMWGKVSEMCDVYSFGILLLELISGRKPIEQIGATKWTIVEWAGPLILQGNLHDLADPKLCSKFHEYELTRVVQAATMCAQNSPANRPTMQQVVEMLKDLNQGSTELQDSGSKDWRH